MYLILLLMFFILPLSASDSYEQGKRFAEEQLKNRHTAKEDKEMLRKKIAYVKAEQPVKKSNGVTLSEITGKCVRNSQIQSDLDPSLYIFVSFSMPREALLSLSKEVEKLGGVMVLRGLPENSFKQLAVSLHRLRKQGLSSTVQVDPRLFSKYGITNVPAFVVKQDGGFDKLAGNVSLAFALEKIKQVQEARKIL